MPFDPNKPFEVIEPGQTKPTQPQKKKSALKSVLDFIGEATGASGVNKLVGQVQSRLPLIGTGTPQKIEVGKGLASIGKVGLTAATFLSGGAAAGIKGAIGVGARAVENGIVGAAFQALSNMESGKKTGKGLGGAAAIGAAIPIVGGALSGAKSTIGSIGRKIQQSVIRPTAADIADGFTVNTLKKYNLGGSLGQTLEKAESKLAELGKQLAEKVKRTDLVVDLNRVYRQTAESLTGGRASNFGNIQSIRRVLSGMSSEIAEVSENGVVNLGEAQLVKQAAGKKGAWVFGSADPDATATERVYTSFYRNLRKQIEDVAPDGVREINKQIGEILPVLHAVIRRIPVAERNNIISMSDAVNLGLTAVDPRAAALFLVNRLSKSGRFGNLLAGFESRPATTNIGARIFGR